MENDLQALLNLLESEIDRKCFAIQQKKRGKKLQRLFIAGCALLLTAPIPLAFLGPYLIAALIPALVILAVTCAALALPATLTFKEDLRHESL